MFSQRYSLAPLMSPLRSCYYKQPPDEFCQIEGTGTAAQTLIICVNRVNLLNNLQQHSWEHLTLLAHVPWAVFVSCCLWGSYSMGQLYLGCPQRMSEISSLFASTQKHCWELGADTGYVRQGEEELLCFSVIWPKVHEQLCKWKGGQGYSSLISPGSCSSGEGWRLLCLFTHPLPFSPLPELPKYP